MNLPGTLENGTHGLEQKGDSSKEHEAMVEKKYIKQWAKENRKIFYVKLFFKFLIALGFIGWMGMDIIGCFVDTDAHPMHGVEFPLGEIYSIAVDSKNEIYCAGDYGRIQVYDTTGKFLRGFFIHQGKSDYKMKMDKDENIHIVNNSSNLHYVHDRTGKRLLKEKVKDKYINSFYYSYGNPLYRKGPVGTHYRATGWLFPVVYKETRNDEETIISVPFYLWLLQAPLPAWFIFVIGFLGMGFASLWDYSEY